MISSSLRISMAGMRCTAGFCEAKSREWLSHGDGFAEQCGQAPSWQIASQSPAGQRVNHKRVERIYITLIQRNMETLCPALPAGIYTF